MKVAMATAIKPVKNSNLTVIPILYRKNKGFLLVLVKNKRKKAHFEPYPVGTAWASQKCWFPIVPWDIITSNSPQIG